MRLLSAAIATLALASCSGEKEIKGPPVVAIETSLGTIEVELAPRSAPLTVENFLTYVDDKHFDGTAFHRVISGFMVQGGGYALEKDMLMEKETRRPIKNEAKTSALSNTRGTIAMARTNDPDSATAQFFINLTDNSQKLDPGQFTIDGYTAFGKVKSGMEVVDQIAAVETKSRTLVSLSPNGSPVARSAEDVPTEDVLITSIRRVGD